MNLEEIFRENQIRKLIWKVDSAPTGPYRSFQKRGWPSAEFNGEMMIMLRSEDSYNPRSIASGDHAPIRVSVADRRPEHNEVKNGFTCKRLKGEFATLSEAKAAA